MGEKEILKPEKVFTDKTGTGDSAIFNAQWYPDVTAVILRTGGTAHEVKLQGSLDATNWVDVSTAITGDHKSVTGEWYLYWRIVIVSNDGTINAWIGCGGA